MFKFSRKSVGTIGEQIALKYLQKEGYKLLYQNWKCKIGEVDLILQDGKHLVFVEVKSRRNFEKFIFENITYTKQIKLRTLAEFFLKIHYQYRKFPPRIDAVGIIFESEDLSLYKIKHIRGAV